MKNEWHIPQNGWHVTYKIKSAGAWLVLHTDGDTIHVSAASAGVEIPLIDIPLNRLRPGQWSVLMHHLQLALEGDIEHD